MSRQLLEDFVIDNPDLERLEELLDQFNIFEAIGVVRQELRHSDFLAFLLNPLQLHGLGDAFLKNILQKVLLAARGTDLPINLIDLDVWSLEETTVQREWRNIDILLLNEEKKLAVIIENKVGSSEHSEQLKRYREITEQSCPGYSIIGLYLTPEGGSPSDERFLPVSYGTIAELIESLVKRRESTLGADIKTLMTHYAQMLRRHIVSESEIAELCRKIYQKHQRALDLIFEHRPDVQEQILNVIEQLALDFGGFVIDKRTPGFLCLAMEDWDRIIGLNPEPIPGNRSSGKRALILWVRQKPSGVRLVLEIYPGPSDIRQRLFAMARTHKPFAPKSKALSEMYTRIWSRQLLGRDWQDKYSVDEVEAKLREQWSQFLVHDLPKIREAISQGMTSNGK